MQKKLHVIQATTTSANEIRKVKSNNSFIVGDFATPEFGKFKVGLLLTKDVGEDQAKKMLEAIGDNEKGKFFFAYVPLQNLDACEIYQNLGLSIDETQRYFDTQIALIGLDEYIYEEAMKYKLAA